MTSIIIVPEFFDLFSAQSCGIQAVKKKEWRHSGGLIGLMKEHGFKDNQMKPKSPEVR